MTTLPRFAKTKNIATNSKSITPQKKEMLASIKLPQHEI